MNGINMEEFYFGVRTLRDYLLRQNHGITAWTQSRCSTFIGGQADDIYFPLNSLTAHLEHSDGCVCVLMASLLSNLYGQTADFPLSASELTCLFFCLIVLM